MQKFILSFFVGVALVACGGGGSSSTTTSTAPATVVSVSPGNGATTMMANPKVYLRLNKPLLARQEESAYLDKIALYDNAGNKVPSTTVVSNTAKTVYVQLSESLQPATQYVLKAPLEMLTANCINCAAVQTAVSVKSSTADTATITAAYTVVILTARYVYFTPGITSNFEYVANAYFGAESACASGHKEACFSGSTANGVSAGNYICMADQHAAGVIADGSAYYAFLTSQGQPQAINYDASAPYSVLGPDDDYLWYSSTGTTSTQLFKTNSAGAIDVGAGGTGSDPSISATYWTGMNSSGQPSGNDCISWSIASYYPTNGGYGQSGYEYFNWNGNLPSSATDVYDTGATYGCGIVNGNSVNKLSLMCVQNAAPYPQPADVTNDQAF